MQYFSFCFFFLFFFFNKLMYSWMLHPGLCLLFDPHCTGLWTKCLHFEELHAVLFYFRIRDQLHGQVLMFTVGESCFVSLSAKRKSFVVLILTIGCCLGDYQSKIDCDKISLLRISLRAVMSPLSGSDKSGSSGWESHKHYG